MPYNLMSGKIDEVIVAVVEAGSDIRSAIEEVAKKEGLASGIVLSGIGTLKRAVLRNPKTDSIPPEVSLIEIDGPVELLSLEGNISIGIPEGPDARGGESINVHLHAIVSNKEGRTFGGSVASGNIVWRQVELVIARISGIALRRELEQKTKLTRLVLRKT
ncbi:MAG: DNA-binding protein [Candidatus Bathyarchaeia archaeon]